MLTGLGGKSSPYNIRFSTVLGAFSSVTGCRNDSGSEHGELKIGLIRRPAMAEPRNPALRSWSSRVWGLGVS